MSEFTIDAIIEKYLSLRDQIEAINAECEKRTSELKLAQEGLKTYLMAVANKTGQTKFGTKSGTAFLTTKTGCSVSDWNSTKAYIVEHGAWELLNKAVNKTAVGEYIDMHGVPPPGVNWTVIKDIQFRKA